MQWFPEKSPLPLLSRMLQYQHFQYCRSSKTVCIFSLGGMYIQMVCIFNVSTICSFSNFESQHCRRAKGQEYLEAQVSVIPCNYCTISDTFWNQSIFWQYVPPGPMFTEHGTVKALPKIIGDDFTIIFCVITYQVLVVFFLLSRHSVYCFQVNYIIR